MSVFVKVIDPLDSLFDCVGVLTHKAETFAGVESVEVNIDGCDYWYYLDQIQVWEGD